MKNENKTTGSFKSFLLISALLASSVYASFLQGRLFELGNKQDAAFINEYEANTKLAGSYVDLPAKARW